MLNTGCAPFIWQQILALDARYNAHRTSSDPAFRALYIRRRSQLLRENSKRWADDANRRDYLQKRAEILAERYGYVPSDGSAKSRSVSIRSGSQITLEGEDAARKTIGANRTQRSKSKYDDYLFEEVHQVLENCQDSITRLRFAHDEKYRLAIASMDRTVCVVNLSENELVRESISYLKGHQKGVVDIAWSVSNDLLLSCSLDATLRLWDPTSAECLRIVEDTSAILCCLFQPVNNNLVVTGNLKGLVQVLNISTGKYLKTGTCRTPGAAMCMCCDNAGRLLWVGDDKGFILSFIMDSTLGKLVKGRRIHIANDCPITSLSCRPASTYANLKQPLLLVNVASNSLDIYSVKDTTGSLQPRRRIALQHRRLTLHSAFCPLISYRQGAFAVSGSEDGFVHFFDVESNNRYSDLKLKGHCCPVIDVCFNHDESLLVSGDSKGKVIIWRRKKPKQENE